jgi:DNA-binding transcriptional regulator GbsR (MarR family)
MANEPESPSAAHIQRRVVRVCDAIGAFIEYWGFKAVHGRIWTLLALSRTPLSQTQVAQVLGVSRSLVSGAMSELMEHGLVRPVDDARKAPYVAVLDVWPTISDVLRAREWMLVEGVRQTLEAAIAEAEDAGDTQWDLGRMRMLLGMTELGQILLKGIISIRTPRGAERFATWLSRAVGLARRFRSN